MNTTASQIAADQIQHARAAHMRDLFEPWSFRKLEGRTGIGRSSLQTKFSGNVPFTLGDIEILAPLVRMNAIELASELYSITGDNEKAPTVETVRAVSLPELDSNQQPAGSRLAPVHQLPIITDTTDNPETGHLAPVLAFG